VISLNVVYVSPNVLGHFRFKQGKGIPERFLSVFEFSDVSPGILSHLRAYYGVPELTECANFHGHFLIWLMGGLNQTDLHQQLKGDHEFSEHFFDFFEDIICHELPDDDIHVNADFDPQLERPPQPPTSESPISELNSWNSAFVTQIKVCGEDLQ
jgi:hypothetical protein